MALLRLLMQSGEIIKRENNEKKGRHNLARICTPEPGMLVLSIPFLDLVGCASLLTTSINILLLYNKKFALSAPHKQTEIRRRFGVSLTQEQVNKLPPYINTYMAFAKQLQTIASYKKPTLFRVTRAVRMMFCYTRGCWYTTACSN